MITCAEAVSRLWDYVERALPAEQEAQIDEHIDVCRQCCGEADFAGELRGFLATHAQDALPPEAHGRLEAFLTKLEGCEGGA